MTEKHPLFWKVDAFVNRREVARLRAQLAALLAQQAEANLITVFTAAGLDPKAAYASDDEAETITPQSTPPVAVPAGAVKGPA